MLPRLFQLDDLVEHGIVELSLLVEHLEEDANLLGRGFDERVNQPVGNDDRRGEFGVLAADFESACQPVAVC
jgi:hypothetical protein